MQPRLFTNKPLLACAVLACAMSSAPTLAQTWNSIFIHSDEAFHRVETGLRATPGDTLRYSFQTPNGITQLRVELAGENGNANLKVYRDSPNAAPACDSRQAGSNEQCALAWTDSNAAKTPPATWYVEVTAVAAFDNVALTLSYLPEFRRISNLPDMPFAIARRATFKGDPRLATTCLQPRYPDQAFALPEVACMPVGNPQSWHFEMGWDHEYRIKNAWTGRCLGMGEGDAWVEDVPCNQVDDGQRWKVHGGAGASHFVVLQNARNGQCVDFDESARVTLVVPCRFGAADMPAWALRDVGERIYGAMADDGATFSLIEGVRCIADDGTRTFLAECSDRAATRRMMYSAIFGDNDIDWWSGDFQLVSVTNEDRCMSAESAAGEGIVFRDCKNGDASQKWTPQLWNGKASEWQLRNVHAQKCLVSKNGASAAGTDLVLGDCAVDDRTTRWRYVGL